MHEGVCSKVASVIEICPSCFLLHQKVSYGIHIIVVVLIVITFGVAISIRQVGVNSFKVKCASDVIYLRLPARYTFPIKSIIISTMPPCPLEPGLFIFQSMAPLHLSLWRMEQVSPLSAPSSDESVMNQ